jgi:hypothetical protein
MQPGDIQKGGSRESAPLLHREQHQSTRHPGFGSTSAEQHGVSPCPGSPSLQRTDCELAVLEEAVFDEMVMAKQMPGALVSSPLCLQQPSADRGNPCAVAAAVTQPRSTRMGLIQRKILSASVACLVMLVTGNMTAISAADALERGRNVFAEKCADCHGARGEGNPKQYPQPLIGDRSLKELTDYVVRTMPKDHPEDCVGEEAVVVALFIYESFYSPAAQVRNAPAKLEMTRLTERQHREALADVIGSFRWTNHWRTETGLNGEYFKSRKFWEKDDRRLERNDQVIRFDFGEGSPLAGEIPDKEFGIRWKGAVQAVETGDYEFIVRTENAVRLWVNDEDEPLIDAWVKSGSDTEFRGSIKLLGGRAYPLRLEYYKAMESRGSVSLSWKPPRQAEHLIPANQLSTRPYPPLFVLTTAFPADDRSLGYERGTFVNKAWEQSVTDAALETAEYVLKNLRRLSGAKEDDGDRVEKIRKFAGSFVERAFGRPLTDEQRQLFVNSQFAEAETPEAALKRTVVLTLLSPRFLYRDADRSNDPYAVAARLSFTLWDSVPDEELLKAARQGKLKTRQQVQEQAERMLDDDRTHAKMQEFLRQWLKMDHFYDLSKDAKTFPEFNAELASDLRISLELFLRETVWSDRSDFRELLQSESLYLNGRLAGYYGVTLPPEAPFQPVKLPGEVRVGVLTHPYLLAGLAYTSTSSPIHRGVFLSRSLLGRALRPPPEAVAPLSPDLHASLTTRERVVLQTQAESCQSCHAMINPLGFTLENFDAVGRFREHESGKPVDATGTYITRSGETVHFDGVRDLAQYLSESEETRLAFTEQLFHYFVKQPIRAFPESEWTDLERSFAEHNYSMQKLLVDIAVRAAWLPESTPEGSQQRADATRN